MPHFAYTLSYDLPPMPAITAVLHTSNDALRLGRALETLYPCDEVLIIDHGSRDNTVELACEYGARVIGAESEASLDHYLQFVRAGWIFLLNPHESVAENLAASLFEWKSDWQQQPPSHRAYSVRVREETKSGWIARPTFETRLVPTDWNRWHGAFPAHDESAPTLEGELLRFAFP